MKVEGIEYFAEDVVRHQKIINNNGSDYCSLEDAIKACEAGYRTALYEKYLVAKLEQNRGEL